MSSRSGGATTRPRGGRRRGRTTTEAPTPPPPPPDEPLFPDYVWTILFVVAILIFVAICLGLSYWYYRRRKMKSMIEDIQKNFNPEAAEEQPTTVMTDPRVIDSMDSVDSEGNRAYSTDVEEGQEGYLKGGYDPRSASEPRNMENGKEYVDASGRSVSEMGQARLGKRGSEEEEIVEGDIDPTNLSPGGTHVRTASGRLKRTGKSIVMVNRLAPKSPEPQKREGSARPGARSPGLRGGVDKVIEGKSPTKKGAPMGKNIFDVIRDAQVATMSTFQKTGGRLKSAGQQTTPSSSFMNIPGLCASPEAADEAFQLEGPLPGRKFFVYLISDSTGAIYKKDCIGRVMIPAESYSLSLGQLRHHLLKADDEVLRQTLRANKSFRFVTETYRFVAQPEAIAPVEEFFPQQGIYIKFTEGAQTFPPEMKHMAPKSGISNRAKRKVAPAVSPSALASLHTPEEHFEKRYSPSLPPVKSPYQNKKGKQEYEQSIRNEEFRRRHIECISPLPMKFKDAKRKQALLVFDNRKVCDNKGCQNRALYKCSQCNAAYCSPECRKEDWWDHREICRRPPWRW